MALKVVEANGCQKRSYPVLLSPLKAPVRPAESVTFAKAEGSGWAYLYTGVLASSLPTRAKPNFHNMLFEWKT